MATADELIVKVRAALAEPDPGFWESVELLSLLADSIREVEAMSPHDALKTLLAKVIASSGGSGLSAITLTSEYRSLVSFRCYESNGLFGRQWDWVDEKYLDERRVAEGNLTQGNTVSRLICVSGTGTAGVKTYRLYPSIATSRLTEKSVIKLAQVTGEMDLPDSDPDLQTLAVYRTIEKAAAKDSRDLLLSKKYGDMFVSGITIVREIYGKN